MLFWFRPLCFLFVSLLIQLLLIPQRTTAQSPTSPISIEQEQEGAFTKVQISDPQAIAGAPGQNETIPGRYFVRHKEKPIAQALSDELHKKKPTPGQTAAQLRAQVASAAAARINAEKSALTSKLDHLGLRAADKIARHFSKASNVSVLKDLTPEQAELLLREGIDIHPVEAARIELLDSVPLVGADQVWNQLDESSLPVKGRNIEVGVIDTGIDWTHPAFGACTTEQFNAGQCARVPAGYNFITPGSPPMDDNKHGTHVAGTIGASGARSGVAPAVIFHALKVCTAGGSCPHDAILGALEYSVDPNGDSDFSDHLDVINLSLGGAGHPDDVLSLAIDAVYAAGVTPVVAAGNSGPSAQTVGSPGTARHAITVGATYPRDIEGTYYTDVNPRRDQIAPFSSRGPVIWNGGQNKLFKPDITAPGVHICAAKAGVIPEGSSYACAENHLSLSGTSMATPHVAGAAALLLDAHPDWTPREVKNALLQSALNLNNPATEQPYARTDQGYGRLQALSAVLLSPAPLIAELETDGVLSSTSAAIIGSASGPGYSGYVLEARRTGDANWFLLGQSSLAVDRDVLAFADAEQMASGEYELRLTVTSAHGSRQAFAAFMVQNTTITAPASIQTASASANQLIFSTRDTIQVRGSAAGTDFDFYTISWCPYAGGECRTDGVMLENNGQTPLREAVLGQFNLSSTSNVLPGLYYISLITHRTNAQTEEARSLIYIDPLLKENSSQPFPLVCVSIGCYSLLQQPIAYDINHDGKAEIIFAYYDTIKITDERLNPLPGWPYILPQNGGLTQLPPSVGDIDNDGQEEIVVLAGAKLYAFEHDGSLMSGFPQDSFDYGSSGYVFTSPRVLVDLNGDGYKEILSANMRAVDALGRQPAGWNPVQPDAPANQSASWSYGPAAADIDLDGQSEVAAISLGGAQVTLRLFAANGALRWSRTVSGVYAGEPTLVDLDGDSRAEILFTASDANLIHVYAYKHDGTPANGFPRDLTGYATADSRPAPVSAADFTLDGVPELVALGNNCIYILSAAGNLLRTICNSSSRAYYTAQIANLDADPEPEIITAIRGASGLSYGNNAIFGQFAYNFNGSTVEGFPKPIFGIPDSAHRPIADIDGDGANEFFMVSTGRFYVWELPACAAAQEEWPTHLGASDFTKLYRGYDAGLCSIDDDNDGIPDVNDNCPLTANPGQLDSDHDGIGDACDTDNDNDSVPDVSDNCPAAPNAGQSDADNDGIGDACDNDADNDGATDQNDNCPAAANPAQTDTDSDGQGDACDADDDNDGVTDEQEVVDGTNPLDPESRLRRFAERACAPLNTFLGMYNVLEVRNQSLFARDVRVDRTNMDNTSLGSLGTTLAAQGQFDFLVHDHVRTDIVGRACAVMADAQSGDLDGMMVYYKPSTTPGRDQFALAVPLSNGETGELALSWNTFHPSLDPRDSGKVVALYASIVNESNALLRGTYTVINSDAVEVERRTLALNPGERRDLNVHQHGPNQVGLLLWTPENNSQPARFFAARYMHDNTLYAPSYVTAFVAEGRSGSNAEQVAPLDTAIGTAVLELNNLSKSNWAAFNVEITNEQGVVRSSRPYYVAPLGSYHLIADSILQGEKGIARVASLGGERYSAAAMHYERTQSGAVRRMYGVAAEQALGLVLRASYNTFLNQSVELQLVNSADTPVTVEWRALRLDQTLVETRSTTIPAHGLAVEAFADQPDVYGTIMINVPAAHQNKVAAWLLRVNEDHIIPLRASPQ